MIKYPVIGLSPMDGVTDVVFRELVDKISCPDILYTEFVPVEGLVMKKPAVMKMLFKHKTKTPVFAQLFGNNPKLFYQAAKIILELGFDGVDINMGCPDRNISQRGSGAGLIKTPKIAKEIIISVKKSIAGKIPVSVKTRIGYEKPQTETWIKSILETEPDIITLHGRTYSQRYSGLADWEEIAKAAQIIKKTKTKIFGNGDIKSLLQAKEYIKKYQLDGVLIGRASLGNPWIFSQHKPSNEEKLTMVLRHGKLFQKYFPEGDFRSLRKHFVWYVKGLPNATDLKNDLMKVENINELKKVLKSAPATNRTQI